MLKVLVVEDEPYVRRGIVLSVDWTALDCFVVGEAANGEEGYDAALKFQPNIIITDIRMPKMDGIEMLKRLREAGCKSEVIILTAYSDFEYATQNALHYGAADYLLKPFHDGELEQVIVSIHSRLMARQGNAAESLPALQLKKGDKSKYVMESLAYIAGHYNDPDIRRWLHSRKAQSISEGYLCHIFKKETNYTLMEYLSQYRMHVAMQLLRDCRVKTYEVAEQVGYRDIAYFSSMFRKIVGVTPFRVSGQVQIIRRKISFNMSMAYIQYNWRIQSLFVIVRMFRVRFAIQPAFFRRKPAVWPVISEVK